MSPTGSPVKHVLRHRFAKDARGTTNVTVTPGAVYGARHDGDFEARQPSLVNLTPLRPWYLPVKRGGDIVLALLLLIVSMPLLVAAGALIKLTSRGPILYRQVRLGMNGRPFRLIKLRTMKHNAEGETGPAWSAANDSRVTAIGAVLRQTHLDEFPQLWNVIRGEMSLIGPRPERPEFTAPLEEQIPFYRERTRIRPGITGLAQLRLPPDSSLESVGRKVVHDVYYVRNVNPILDMQLSILTACRLIGEISRVIDDRLVPPGSDAIDEGFRQAVGLSSGAVVPGSASIISLSTLISEVRSDVVRMRACTE